MKKTLVSIDGYMRSSVQDLKVHAAELAKDIKTALRERDQLRAEIVELKTRIRALEKK